MIEAQHGGMQIEVGGGRLGVCRSIEMIAQYGVTYLHHVDSKLMRATRDGFELHQAAIRFHPLADVVGDGSAAMFIVDLLTRS